MDDTGYGGYTYLLEPLWWAGMVTSEFSICCYLLFFSILDCNNKIISNFKFCLVIVGEAANFVAYIYAPAVLVTPLGALSIIIRYLCHDHFALLCVCDLCDINLSFFSLLLVLFWHISY